MWNAAIRGLAGLGLFLALAGIFAESRASLADDDVSSSLLGSWRGTRHAPGTTAVRRNLISFLPGGVALGAGSSPYVTGVNFGNGNFVETGFVGVWVSEGHGNFVAHLIANLSEAPAGKGTALGTENLTFRFHIENGKSGKELKGTQEGIFLDPQGNTLALMPSGLTWDAVPLTITSNGYN